MKKKQEQIYMRTEKYKALHLSFLNNKIWTYFLMCLSKAFCIELFSVYLPSVISFVCFLHKSYMEAGQK